MIKLKLVKEKNLSTCFGLIINFAYMIENLCTLVAIAKVKLKNKKDQFKELIENKNYKIKEQVNLSTKKLNAEK